MNQSNKSHNNSDHEPNSASALKSEVSLQPPSTLKNPQSITKVKIDLNNIDDEGKVVNKKGKPKPRRLTREEAIIHIQNNLNKIDTIHDYNPNTTVLNNSNLNFVTPIHSITNALNKSMTYNSVRLNSFAKINMICLIFTFGTCIFYVV